MTYIDNFSRKQFISQLVNDISQKFTTTQDISGLMDDLFFLNAVQGSSIPELATAMDKKPATLYQLQHKKALPNLNTFVKMLDALGLEMTFQKKGD